MRFRPAIWFPIAVGLSIINLVAVGFAAREGEPWHAATHAALALAFGVWAARLRRGGGGGGGGDDHARFDALEAEVSRLRHELGEAQERLDFTERMLAQQAEARRVGPER